MLSVLEPGQDLGVKDITLQSITLCSEARQRRVSNFAIAAMNETIKVCRFRTLRGPEIFQ